MLNQKGIAPIFLLLGVVILFGILAGAYYFNNLISKPALQTDQNISASASPTYLNSPPTASSSNQLVSLKNIPDEIIKSTLVYQGQGVHILKGLNNQPLLIDSQGSSPVYNSVLSKVAYVKMDTDNNIHIYDVKTGQTEVVKTSEGRLRNVAWSPDGKYILTDSGTSNNGAGAVYTYPSAKKVATFPTISRTLDEIKWLWISSDTFVTVEQYENPNPPPVEGGEWLQGITKHKLPENIETPIIKPSQSEGYFPLLVENGVIYYTSNYIDNDSSKYWQINIDGTNKKEITQLDVPTRKILSIIRQNLPTTFKNSQITDLELVRKPNYPQWLVFSVYPETNVVEGGAQVFIMNLEEPQKTLTKITTGSNPAW